MDKHAMTWVRENEALLQRLTPRQRDCLRLVANGYRTKEIAIKLGISVGVAYKHISSACQTLGVPARGQAARYLALWEQQLSEDEMGKKLPPQFLGVSDPADLPSGVTVTNDADTPAIELTEQQQDHFVVSAVPGLMDLVPMRIRGRSQNDLTTVHTMIVIGAMTLGTIVGVGSAASLLTGLTSLLRP
ncbi:helix-turn-helix domain-containing protein [Novosphingobium kaempferiae]|uniref:helix-turn-helix domain-containing protein n=1 Tax=Novosphingobium kaempferiae TaxID=2896849 RepID=UPI001E3E8690|nr:helix-turn-helix transcriptional regulator [Novosphingobium kaempferiae]